MNAFLRHIKNNFAAYVLLAAFGFLFFYHLDYSTLASWDEAWYASIAREIVRTGDVMHLMWNGKPYFDHPPLGFWLIAASYRLFGINEFTTRLPSVILGCATIALMYAIGKRFFNKAVGFSAAMILGTCVWYTIRVRSGNLDAMFVFFYVLSIYLSIRAAKNIRWFPAAAASFACLMLTKTLVGASALPIMLVIIAVQLRHIKKTLPFLVLGVIAAAAIITPWYWVNYHAYPNFIQHHFLEIGTRNKTWRSYFELHPEQPLFFLHMGIRKWYYLWIAGAAYLLLTLRFIKKPVAVVLLWNLVILYPFMTAKETQLWHLIPVYAPVAFVTAYGIYTCMTDLAAGARRLSHKKIKSILAPRTVAAVYLLIFVAVAILQFKVFRAEVWQPEHKYTPDEVDISQRASGYPKVYLDDDFLPMAVYYSGRNLYPMYDLASFGETTDKRTLVGLFQSSEQNFVAITRWWAVQNLDAAGIPYHILQKNNSFSIVSR